MVGTDISGACNTTAATLRHYQIAHSSPAESEPPAERQEQQPTVLAVREIGDREGAGRRMLDELLAGGADRVTLLIPARPDGPDDACLRLTVAAGQAAGPAGGHTVSSVFPYRLDEVAAGGDRVIAGNFFYGAVGSEPFEIEAMAIVALDHITTHPSCLPAAPSTQARQQRYGALLSGIVKDYRNLVTSEGLDDLEAAATVTVLHGLTWDPEWVASDPDLSATAADAVAALQAGLHPRDVLEAQDAEPGPFDEHPDSLDAAEAQGSERGRSTRERLADATAPRRPTRPSASWPSLACARHDATC